MGEAAIASEGRRFIQSHRPEPMRVARLQSRSSATVIAGTVRVLIAGDGVFAQGFGCAERCAVFLGVMAATVLLTGALPTLGMKIEREKQQRESA